jgi:hypothetical protein
MGALRCYISICRRFLAARTSQSIHDTGFDKAMDSVSVAADVAALLDAVADGAISASQALARWPTVSDRRLKIARHEVTHVENDIDIRERDPDYARYQRDSLRELAWQVRQRFGIE